MAQTSQRSQVQVLIFVSNFVYSIKDLRVSQIWHETWNRCFHFLHRKSHSKKKWGIINRIRRRLWSLTTQALQCFRGSPSRPRSSAVHHAALNWGNGVMSASWLGLKSLITARLNGPHNPLLHPAGCWDDNGGGNTEALHQPLRLPGQQHTYIISG